MLSALLLGVTFGGIISDYLVAYYINYHSNFYWSLIIFMFTSFKLKQGGYRSEAMLTALKFIMGLAIASTLCVIPCGFNLNL